MRSRQRPGRDARDTPAVRCRVSVTSATTMDARGITGTLSSQKLPAQMLRVFEHVLMGIAVVAGAGRSKGISMGHFVSA